MMPHIEFEVWCAKCGAGLCRQCDTTKDGRGITVEPCEQCLDAKYAEGHDSGYSDGYDEAAKGSDNASS